MAGNISPYPIIYTPEDARTFTRRLCLPLKLTCPPLQAPFISDPSQSWNCLKCPQDPKYCIPFRTGDTIPLQLRLEDFINTDPLNLTAGWQTATSTEHYITAQLLDCNCEPVPGYETIDTFSGDYWVGYDSDYGSMQTFFIDTSLLPLDLECFRLKITTYNNKTGELLEETIIHTEKFCRESCEDTVQVCGTYSKEDCMFHYYQIPPSVLTQAQSEPGKRKSYYTCWRIHGQVLSYGHRREQVVNDNDVTTSQKITEVFRLQGSKRIPPYIAKIICTILFSDVEVTIDGTEYEDAQAIEKLLGYGKAFKLDVELYRRCELGC